MTLFVNLILWHYLKEQLTESTTLLHQYQEQTIKHPIYLSALLLTANYFSIGAYVNCVLRNNYST